jgi:phage terminase large subunit
MIPQKTKVDSYEWQATNVFFRNLESKKFLVVNVGGSRSSKSFSISQLMMYRFLHERNKTFLTTRKTFPALRITALKVAVDQLQHLRLYQHLEHNKTQNYLRNPFNNNLWFFLSIDDPQKIRSTEFNYAHMEEANEFNYEDFRMLKLRMSGQNLEGERNQIILSLNPSDATGWIRSKLLPVEDHDLIHSTYKDNPFLPDEYVEELESLKDQDDEYWQIYGLGLWAKHGELIFGSPSIVRSIPKNIEETIFGLDFGYNNPTVLDEIGIKDKTCYHREVIYQTHLTNSQLIDLMKETMSDWDRTRPIYADSAEPARISEIRSAGFNIVGASKNVLDGIDFTKRFEHATTAENVNFIREWSRYKWRKDKKSGEVLDEPVKFEDHYPDAGRMAIYTHLGRESGGVFIGDPKSDIVN